MSSPTPNRIRILLIDDHAVVREGLCLLIERHPELAVVGEAANGAEALAIAGREHPDIILLDIDLHGESGLDLLPGLLAVAKHARVIILTGLLDSQEHRRAVRLGAMGLVLKEQASQVLVTAIKKVYAGEAWLDPSMVASVLAEMSHRPAAKGTNPQAARITALTAREREVIALVGQGFKNKLIAERLSISETTVSHHLTSIFDKLGVTNRFDLVIYAYRHGLAQPPN